jgi:transcriptional regulator with XRE-family HTH domain
MENSRIPNSLKRYRRIAGLSQVQVAAKLGLRQSSCISLWEKGYSMPGTEYLFRLSILYNTVPNKLYGDFFQSLQQELFAQHELISTNNLPAMTT